VELWGGWGGGGSQKKAKKPGGESKDRGSRLLRVQPRGKSPESNSTGEWKRVRTDAQNELVSRGQA